MSGELASLRVTDAEGVDVVFTLTWQGWACSDPTYQSIADSLTGQFGMQDYSPAEGAPGARQAALAEKWFKEWPEISRVEIRTSPQPAAKPGTVY